MTVTHLGRKTTKTLERNRQKYSDHNIAPCQLLLPRELVLLIELVQINE
jgi:hypothetical protein